MKIEPQEPEDFEFTQDDEDHGPEMLAWALPLTFVVFVTGCFIVYNWIGRMLN